MFGGKAFGKRKLAPTVSPNKTIAGFISGLFGGVIVAVIMHFWRLPDTAFPILIGAGVVVSIIGQLGDLVESCWKRAVEIKDSSAIIPGHGGVLDRFDSLVFSAPVLYAYLYFLKIV
jgi:phosphatidate cytidylyltransferase